MTLTRKNNWVQSWGHRNAWTRQVLLKSVQSLLRYDANYFPQHGEASDLDLQFTKKLMSRATMVRGSNNILKIPCKSVQKSRRYREQHFCLKTTIQRSGAFVRKIDSLGHIQHSASNYTENTRLIYINRKNKYFWQKLIFWLGACGAKYLPRYKRIIWKYAYCLLVCWL